MHVVKREFMYVSKPFAGEGGGGCKGLQNQNWLPNPTPAFSMIPNKGDKIKTQKKNKNKNFTMVSMTQPQGHQIIIRSSKIPSCGL